MARLQLQELLKKKVTFVKGEISVKLLEAARKTEKLVVLLLMKLAVLLSYRIMLWHVSTEILPDG